MIKLTNILLIIMITVSSAFAYEKYFVVQRESESIAVIENGIKYSTIKNMHNMNHGVVKLKTMTVM